MTQNSEKKWPRGLARIRREYPDDPTYNSTLRLWNYGSRVVLHLE
jgi:hypothetical protein